MCIFSSLFFVLFNFETEKKEKRVNFTVQFKVNGRIHNKSQTIKKIKIK